MNGQIAFVSDRDPLGSGNTQVFVMGSGGENPTNLSTNPENEEGPAFSADGSLIAYVGEKDFEEDRFPGEDLYVMRADGTEKRRLTRSDADESQPAFSPDGGRLAFTSFVDGSRGNQIHLAAADGSGETTLLAAPPGEFVGYSDPSWSPDGSRIAFTRSATAGTDVWVIDLTTGLQTPITTGPASESEPDWSPDGSRIVYVADPPGSAGADIWSMNATGGGNVQLTAHPFDETEPVYSPDGTDIAYTRRRNQGGGQAIVTYPGDIYVMAATGGGEHSLSAGVFTGYLNDEASDDDEPSWQASGRAAAGSPPAYRSEIGVPSLVRIPVVGRSEGARASRTRAPRIRFRLNKRASAKLAIERVRRGRKVGRGKNRRCVPSRRRVPRGRRCVTSSLRGWLVRKARRGKNAIRFNGRLGRRALRPGLYRIRAGAVDRRANPARHRRSRTFRVVRSRR